jgi:hypothetical protein
MNPNSFKFLENECKAVQEVRMVRVENGEHYVLNNAPMLHRVHELFIIIDGHLFIDDDCTHIMKNDGLTEGEFMDFFFPRAVNGLGGKTIWTAEDTDKFDHGTWNGRLIHWTEKLY